MKVASFKAQIVGCKNLFLFLIVIKFLADLWEIFMSLNLMFEACVRRRIKMAEIQARTAAIKICKYVHAVRKLSFPIA